MGWVEPVSAALSAAQLAAELRRESSQIQRYARRLVNWIRQGTLIVPVFGAGGVGKTTTGKLLAGADPLDIHAPYQEDWVTAPFALVGDVPGRLLVAPGQAARVGPHWPELLRTVSGGRAPGILNVVSYGYHSLGINSFTEHDEYEAGMGVPAFMRRYTAVRREVELQLLKNVVNHLVAASPPLWMVTLVNKQDLWWSAKKKVRAYYETGPYSEVLSDLRATLGSSGFQHEFLPVSLALGNLATPSGELLATTTAGYDLPTHLRYLHSMFAKLNDLFEPGE